SRCWNQMNGVDLQHQLDLLAGPLGERHLDRRRSDGGDRLDGGGEELLDGAPPGPQADLVVGGAGPHRAQGGEGEVGVAPETETPGEPRARRLVEGLDLAGRARGEGDELLGWHAGEVAHL